MYVQKLRLTRTNQSVSFQPESIGGKNTNAAVVKRSYAMSPDRLVMERMTYFRSRADAELFFTQLESGGKAARNAYWNENGIIPEYAFEIIVDQYDLEADQSESNANFASHLLGYTEERLTKKNTTTVPDGVDASAMTTARPASWDTEQFYENAIGLIGIISEYPDANTTIRTEYWTDNSAYTTYNAKEEVIQAKAAQIIPEGVIQTFVTIDPDAIMMAENIELESGDTAPVPADETDPPAAETTQLNQAEVSESTAS